METSQKVLKKVTELTQEFQPLEILQLCKELKIAVTPELTTEEKDAMKIQAAIEFANQYFAGKTEANFTDYMIAARKAGVGHISIMQVEKIFPDLLCVM